MLTVADSTEYACEKPECEDGRPALLRTEAGEYVHPECVAGVPAAEQPGEFVVTFRIALPDCTKADDVWDTPTTRANAPERAWEVFTSDSEVMDAHSVERQAVPFLVVENTPTCPYCGGQKFQYRESYLVERSMASSVLRDDAGKPARDGRGSIVFHGDFEWDTGNDDPGIVCDDWHHGGCGAVLTTPEGVDTDYAP